MWIILAILSLISYTFWGVLNGVVSKHVDAYSGIFFSGIGYLLAGFIALAIVGFKFSYLTTPIAGITSGVSLGIATGLGGLFVLLSLTYGGNANIVVVLTALYPILTVFINVFFFGYSISTLQLVGVFFAVIAIILVSIG